MEIKTFTAQASPTDEEYNAVLNFLFDYLDQYGDPKEHIANAMNYALGRNDLPGGFVLSATIDEDVVGAVVVNRTGMEGYIPENILVYIAAHREHRGKGIGKKLMLKAVDTAEGDVALHVEPDNPAKGLYEHIGFTNKYLEMRFKKDK